MVVEVVERWSGGIMDQSVCVLRILCGRGVDMGERDLLCIYKEMI